MFQSLRIGAPLYVLHKNELKIEQGTVTFVSQPVNQFGQVVYNNSQPANVNIQIQVQDQQLPIDLKNIPATLTIADCGNNRVVSESKDAIITEISILKNNSLKVLNSIEQHKEIVQKCDLLLQELNPQVKIEAERSQEIAGLKSEVNGMKDDMTEIKGMLTKLLNKK